MPMYTYTYACLFIYIYIYQFLSLSVPVFNVGHTCLLQLPVSLVFCRVKITNVQRKKERARFMDVTDKYGRQKALCKQLSNLTKITITSIQFSNPVLP